MGLITPVHFKTKDNEEVIIRTSQVMDGYGMHQLTKEILHEGNGLIMTLEDFQMSVDDQIQKNNYYYQHPRTLSLVAECNKQIIGIITIEPEYLRKTAHRGILGVIIKKEFRSKGIGKTLMQQALQWAKYQAQYEKIELEVLEKNEKAIALYKHLGFELEGVKMYAVKHTDSYENLYQMGMLLK